MSLDARQSGDNSFTEFWPANPQSPQPIDELILPTPSVDELYEARGKGFKRWGVLAPLLAVNEPDNPQIILLQHVGSDKVVEGEWSVMGETSQYERHANGCLRIEPTNHTVQRALLEELGLMVDMTSLRVPVAKPYFDTSWPVGRKYPGQIGLAISPLLLLDENLVDTIMGAPPTVEVVHKQLLPLSDALEVANWEQDTSGRTRLGFAAWMQQLMQHIARVDFRVTAPLANVPWNPTNAPDDALLERL